MILHNHLCRRRPQNTSKVFSYWYDIVFIHIHSLFAFIHLLNCKSKCTFYALSIWSEYSSYLYISFPYISYFWIRSLEGLIINYVFTNDTQRRSCYFWDICEKKRDRSKSSMCVNKPKSCKAYFHFFIINHPKITRQTCLLVRWCYTITVRRR